METSKHAFSAFQMPKGTREHTETAETERRGDAPADLATDARTFAALLSNDSASEQEVSARTRSSMSDARSAPDTDTDTDIVERLRTYIERLFVNEAAGEECVVARLGDGILPGVMLSIATLDGYLNARFDCAQASQWHRLTDRRFELAERMAAAMETGVQVQVIHTPQPESQRDARAGVPS